MAFQPLHLDLAILEKIRNNNTQGWEELYEAYSAAMLGIICKLTNNKKKGEEILVKIFTSNGFEDFLKGTNISLVSQLYKYTFHTTLALCEDQGSRVDAVATIKGLPGIFTVIYKKDSAGNEPGKHVLKPNHPVWLPIYGANMYADMINYS